MPVRKPKKNYRSLTGKFYSLKNRKSIYFESKLERDFFLTLEFNNDVLSYEEQPVRLSYKRNGKTYPYTPDCLVHYASRPSCIVEVKYSDEIKEKKVFLKQKFEQVEEYLNQNEFDFKLLSELDIDPIALENMHFIYNYVTIQNKRMIQETLEKIKVMHVTDYGEILNYISNNPFKQAEYIPYIWYLVLIGKLEIDLSKAITDNTIIKVVQ